MRCWRCAPKSDCFSSFGNGGKTSVGEGPCRPLFDGGAPVGLPALPRLPPPLPGLPRRPFFFAILACSCKDRANTVSGGVRPETIDGCGSAHLGHLGVGKNRQLEQRDVKCRTRALVPHERASQLRSGVFVTLPAGCAAYRLAYVLQQRANDVLFLLVVLVIELFLLLLLLEPPDVATREQQATLSGRQGGQQGACFLTEQ